jgi:hypothetical protein
MKPVDIVCETRQGPNKERQPATNPRRSITNLSDVCHRLNPRGSTIYAPKTGVFLGLLRRGSPFCRYVALVALGEIARTIVES